MRDSTVINDIPVQGCNIVAVYSNGLYRANPAAVAARFPGIPAAWIDVNGTNPTGAGILDVESGDATVGEAVLWTRARNALHPNYPPIIYCNRSTLTPLFNAMGSAGLRIGLHFRLWIATLDGTKTVPDMGGVTAIQYAGEKQTGHHYDESIVYDNTWHAAAPAPTPPAAQHGVLIILPGGTSHPVTSTDLGKTWH